MARRTSKRASRSSSSSSSMSKAAEEVPQEEEEEEQQVQPPAKKQRLGNLKGQLETEAKALDAMKTTQENQAEESKRVAENLRKMSQALQKAEDDYDEDQATIDNLKLTNEQLKSEVSGVKAELVEKNKELEKAKSDLAEKEASLTATQADLDTAKLKVTSLEKEVGQLKREKAQLQTAKEAAEQELKEEYEKQIQKARDDACEAKSRLARRELARSKIEEAKTTLDSLVAEAVEMIKERGGQAVAKIAETLEEWQVAENSASDGGDQGSCTSGEEEFRSFKSHNFNPNHKLPEYKAWLEKSNLEKGNDLIEYFETQKQMGFSSYEYAMRFLKTSRYFTIQQKPDGSKKLGFRIAAMVADFANDTYGVKVTRNPSTSEEADANDDLFIQLCTFFGNKLRRISKIKGPLAQARMELTESQV